MFMGCRSLFSKSYKAHMEAALPSLEAPCCRTARLSTPALLSGCCAWCGVGQRLRHAAAATSDIEITWLLQVQRTLSPDDPMFLFVRRTMLTSRHVHLPPRQLQIYTHVRAVPSAAWLCFSRACYFDCLKGPERLLERGYGYIYIYVEVEVDIAKYDCLRWVSKSVQVLPNGIETVMVLTLTISSPV